MFLHFIVYPKSCFNFIKLKHVNIVFRVKMDGSRPATLSDFMIVDKPVFFKKIHIEKNQENFGDRKRLKT